MLRRRRGEGILLSECKRCKGLLEGIPEVTATPDLAVLGDVCPVLEFVPVEAVGIHNSGEDIVSVSIHNGLLVLLGQDDRVLLEEGVVRLLATTHVAHVEPLKHRWRVLCEIQYKVDIDVEAGSPKADMDVLLRADGSREGDVEPLYVGVMLLEVHTLTEVGSQVVDQLGGDVDM